MHFKPQLTGGTKNGEVDTNDLRSKNIMDSISFAHAKERDSILLVNQMMEHSQTKELLTMSEELNNEFRSKIKMQNELLALQNDEIIKSRYKIEDGFYVNFEVWFNCKMFQDKIIEAIKKDPKNSNLYTMYFQYLTKEKYGKTDIHDYIFNSLAMQFEKALFFLGFYKKETKQALDFSTEIDLVHSDFTYNNSNSNIGMPFDLFNVYFDFDPELNFTKLIVKRMPVSIYRQDINYVTLYDIPNSEIYLSILMNEMYPFMEKKDFYLKSVMKSNDYAHTVAWMELINSKQTVLVMTDFKKNTDGHITPMKVEYKFDKKLKGK